MKTSMHESDFGSTPGASDSATSPMSSVSDAPLRPSLERWIADLVERRMQLERDSLRVRELAKSGF
jgi:hypothetical protein